MNDADEILAAIMEAIENLEPSDVRRLAEDQPEFVPLTDVLLRLMAEPS